MSIRTGDVLRFEWEYGETPAAMEMQLLSAQRYFENTVGVMEVAKRIAIKDMSEHFEREEDPSGQAWHPWADSYEQRAAAENVGILRKSEDLYYAAIDPSSYGIQGEGNELVFDTSGLPDYWVFHDQPTSGGTDRIPARPFIGLSDEAEAEIEAQFVEWVEYGGLRFGGARAGVRTGVIRAPLGRFAAGG